MVKGKILFAWSVILGMVALPGCPPQPTNFVQLTTHAVGGGFVNPAGGTFPQGSQTTITAIAQSGWKFDHWEGDLSGTTNPVAVTLTTDRDITAVFVLANVNRPPSAQDITVTTTVDLPVSFSLVASDPENDPLAYALASVPQHGTLGGTAPFLTYTPDSGFAGGDWFTYRANDGQSDSNLARVNLTITPFGRIGWARSFGGTGADVAASVATDASGNVFVAGAFSGSVDFDPGPDNEIRTAAGDTDAFVGKFAADGSFIWVLTFGGSGEDAALGLAGDGVSGVYVVGYFSGAVDFDPGLTEDFRSSAGGTDIFISRFAAGGTRLWTKTVGGTGQDRAYEAAVDPSGNLFVGGSFADNIDFDPAGPSGGHSSSGGVDGFAVKLASDGSHIWSVSFGGTGDDEVIAVASDPFHKVCLAGYFSDTVDFDPGPGSDQRSSEGVEDVFVVRLTAQGAADLVHTFGGSLSDGARAIECDSAGNIYVGGFFAGSVDFDPGPSADVHNSAGGTDAFAVSFIGTGQFRWAQTLGGPGEDAGLGITLDPAGNVYLAGFFTQSADFDPGAGSDVRNSNGGADIFLTKFSNVGPYIWTDSFGGQGEDRANDLVGNDVFHIYCAGRFESEVDLNPDPIAQQTHHAFGASDVFLFKILGASGQW